MKNRQIQPLLNAYKEIANMAEKLNLPTSIVNRAKDLFTRVKEGRHLNGYSNNTISSACLYVSCHQQGEEGAPRTMKEIWAVGKHSSEKEMSACVKLMVNKLDTPLAKKSASDFIPRFCSDLGLSSNVQEAAAHIARKAVELGLVSTARAPSAVAAGAIYMASQASEEKRTQRQLAKVTGVSDTTIQTIYKLMNERANEVFPSISPDDFGISSAPIEGLPQM